MSGKIKRNLSTPESRAFWEHAERTAAQVDLMLPYKRGGQGEHPIPIQERIRRAADLGCGLELSIRDIKKMADFLKELNEDD